MKRIFVYFFSVVSIGFVYSQNNLISNYSFEKHLNQSCGLSTQNSSQEDFWKKINNWELPDKSNLCLFGEVGSPDWHCSGSQKARSGNYYVFCGSPVEVILQKFSTPLIKGKKYYYEFYYYTNYAEPNEIGLRLELDKPKQCSSKKAYNGKVYTQAHLGANEKDVVESDESNWKRASGYFTAEESYKWLVLGVFSDDFKKNVKFDDVTIREVENFCPEEWLIDNKVFNNNETFQSSSLIKIGRGSNPDVIDGDVIIEKNSTLTLRSNNVVQLIPGLQIKGGSNVEIQLAGCEEKPCELPIFRPISEIEICSGNSKELLLTENNKETWDVTWYPTTYLDNPKSTSPTFYPPPGRGEIEYVIRIKTLCGQSFFKKFSIVYDDSPNINPGHNISFTPDENKFTGLFYGTVVDGMKEVEYEVVNGSFSKSFTLDKIGCCNINIKTEPFPNFETCNNYSIIFRTKNFCTQNVYETTHNLVPPKNNIELKFVNNIISLNHDGKNESLAFTATGASKYKIELLNRWGTMKHSEEGIYSGNVYKEFQEVWTPKDDISSGTYYWYLELESNCGAATKRYTGYIEIMNLLSSNKKETEYFNDSIKYETAKAFSPENSIFFNGKSETLKDGKEIYNKINDSQENMIFVYPNPAKDYININFIEGFLGKNVIIELYNYLGEKILTSNHLLENKIINIPLININPGLYVLIVNSDPYSVNKKIIIK